MRTNTPSPDLERTLRAASETDDGVTSKLTPEQIKNWRIAMIGVLGSYALIMPEDQIQRLRDKMQEWATTKG